jgi:aconitase A
VGGKSYAYYSLAKAAEQLGDVSRLPFSMKVLLENLLRFEDGPPSPAPTSRRWSIGRSSAAPTPKSSIARPAS